MKHIYTLLALFFVVPCFAQTEESRLFIAPGRESFLHFPSQTFGDKYNLRVYLPENAQAKSTRHAVVYLLGWEEDSREAIQTYLKSNDVLVVWVNFTKSDLEQDSANIVHFFTQELLPYIDTNYFTFDTPEKRILVTHGEGAAKTAVALLQKPDLFYFLAAKNAGEAFAQLREWPAQMRVSVTGKPKELSSAQQSLEQAGAQLGTQFVLYYDNGRDEVLGHADLGYFTAEKDALRPVKIHSFLTEKQLPLQTGAAVHLFAAVTLKNKMVSVFIPQTLRMSPPFLDWDAAGGKLSVRAGAERGKVKISGQVDNLVFKTAVKLKKP